RPAIDTTEIEARLDAVAELSASAVALEETRTSFDGMFDLERLLSKITVGTASPRELISLRSSIARLPAIAAALGPLKAQRFFELLGRLDLLGALGALFTKSIS